MYIVCVSVVYSIVSHIKMLSVLTMYVGDSQLRNNSGNEPGVVV